MKRYIIVIPCKLKTNTKTIKIPIFYMESPFYYFDAKDKYICETLHINRPQTLSYNKSFDIHNAKTFKTKKHAKIYCKNFSFMIGKKYYIKPYWGKTTRDNKGITDLYKYWDLYNLWRNIHD